MLDIEYRGTRGSSVETLYEHLAAHALSPQSACIAVGIGLLFVSSTVTMLVPYGIGKVIDMVVDVESGMDKLKKITATIAGVFLIGYVHPATL